MAEPSTPRGVTMDDRIKVGGLADYLQDLGYQATADELLDAVRCCGEFPECSHVLAWYGARASEGGL